MSGRKKSLITLKTIADKVGCSVAVVSRALSLDALQNDTVASETAKAITEAARELGYTSPRTLARQHSAGIIGVFLPDATTMTLLYTLIDAITTSAVQANTPLNIYTAANTQDYLSFTETYVKTSQNVGVIAYYPDIPDDIPAFDIMLEAMKRCGGRVVLIHNKPPQELNCVSVRIDNYRGGQLAAEHLLAQACREFYVVGYPDMSSYRYERIRGFCEAISKRCLPLTVFNCQYVCEHDNFKQQAIFSNIVNFKQWSADAPAGFFIDGDYSALRLQEEMLSGGIAVGKTVKLVAYDNEAFTSRMYPPLSSIKQPFYQMGKVAMQKLLRLMKGYTEKSIVLEPELIAR